MAKLTVAVFFDDDDGGKSNPWVHPGRLVIDGRDAVTAVEFHSFVDEDVELSLPSAAFEAERHVLPAGGTIAVPLRTARERGCFSYRAHLARTRRHAKGGSLPKMIVLN